MLEQGKWKFFSFETKTSEHILAQTVGLQKHKKKLLVRHILTRQRSATIIFAELTNAN